MSDTLLIEFFETRTFSAGQQVQAQVLLDLGESMKARSVEVHISGRAEVHWTVSESKTERRRDMHGKEETHTEHETVHYRSNAVYINKELILWAHPSERIPAGQHRFPFSFQIPAHCPPSFEGSLGHIRYKCTAIIDRPWMFDKKTEASFTVSPFVDLNDVDEWARHPMSQKGVETDIGCCLFRGGQLIMKAHLPKSCFVAGERIPLKMEVDNGTSSEVRKVKASVVQRVVFFGERRGDLHFDCTKTTWSNQAHDFTTKSSSKAVAKLEKPFAVAAHSKGLHQAQLVIPAGSAASSNTCPNIQISYALEIKVETSASCCSSASMEIPLILGTIPVREHPPPPMWGENGEQYMPMPY